MLEETSLQEQLDRAAGDRLRVLVVGAGIAGRTLAQLLRRQGLHPVLVEKSPPGSASGYMLALMPLADPVLTELGLYDAYLTHSEGLHRYRILNRRGVRNRDYAMTRLLSQYGDYRGISRGELLDVLGAPGGTVTHRVTVTRLEQGHREHQGPARVALTDAGATSTTTAAVTGEFDLVVVADGLHSATRELVLRPGDVETYDTDWGGWVTWADSDEEPDLGWEMWGAGLFAGTYPVKDRLGVIVCGPRAETRVGPRRFAERARGVLALSEPRMERVLDAVAHSDERYFWSLTDCRSSTWSVGRVVLLGDAAAGFLPTAGIGACMAMESAGVLGSRLAGAGPEGVPGVLRAYETAQRPRVEAAQENSRQLARLVFRRSRALAVVRDVAARVLPMEAALRPIQALLRDRPTVAESGPAGYGSPGGGLTASGPAGGRSSAGGQGAEPAG